MKKLKKISERIHVIIYHFFVSLYAKSALIRALPPVRDEAEPGRIRANPARSEGSGGRDPGWGRMGSDGDPGGPERPQNGQKMAKNGQKWPKMAKNGQKWPFFTLKNLDFWRWGAKLADRGNQQAPRKFRFWALFFPCRFGGPPPFS